jgi:mannonate dehydratase
MMKVGSRVFPEWLKNEDDEELRYLKQIGGDHVDIVLDVVKGFSETGILEKEPLFKLVDRLDRIGLKIYRANGTRELYEEAHVGGPEGQRQIDNMCAAIELLGEAEIPVYGLQSFNSLNYCGHRGNRWTTKTGRGGYTYKSLNLDDFESVEHNPSLRLTADEIWANFINIYRQAVPVAESAGVNIAMHGNDPPVYNCCGNPNILCRAADFDRLFAEVPSPNNGMTFCVGTRCESGEDVLEMIKHFGEQGKIFHVHFRNVRGTVEEGEYAEVFVDDGDLNMKDVAFALHDAGFDGMLHYDHPVGLSGDDAHGMRYVAFATGYIKGLLAALPPREGS